MEILFEFAEFIEGEEEIDLPLFFNLAKEGKIIYLQTPINEVIHVMEMLKNGFFTNGYFFRR